MKKIGTAELNRLTFEPLSKTNWEKFTELFGEKGACANCWCMFYRLGKKEYEAGQKNGGNKKAMMEIVSSGKPAGLLGMLDEMAIAWCAFAPREDFTKLERSRIHKRIDDKPVWSIPCLFIHKNFRDSGVSGAILKGAINYARENGIKIIEAYPVIPVNGRIPNTFAWYGLYRTFEKSGFSIVDRKSENRPMVRCYTFL